MKYFEASFATVVIRFYLMMGIVIVAFYTGIPWLAIIVLPLFLSSLMGVKTGKNAPESVSKNTKVTLAKNARKAA